MKTITLGFLLFMWMIITLILACSIIGLTILLIRADAGCVNYQGEEGSVPWMKVGKQLLNKLTE